MCGILLVACLLHSVVRAWCHANCMWCHTHMAYTQSPTPRILKWHWNEVRATHHLSFAVVGWGLGGGGWGLGSCILNLVGHICRREVPSLCPPTLFAYSGSAIVPGIAGTRQPSTLDSRQACEPCFTFARTPLQPCYARSFLVVVCASTSDAAHPT